MRPQAGLVQQAPVDYADALDAGVKSALKAFRKEKTCSAYGATVGRFLGLLGDEYGISLSGETYVGSHGKAVGADPNGDELWVAVTTRTSGEFIYAAREHKCPDIRSAEGPLVEFKTPNSASKLNRLLLDASRKFEDYPGKSRNVVLSLLRLPDEGEAAADAAGRFINDGSIDRIWVLHEDGGFIQK